MKTPTYYAAAALALLPAALATPTCAATGSGGTPSASFDGAASVADCYYHCMADTTCLSWAYTTSTQACRLYTKSVSNAKTGEDAGIVRNDRACPTPGQMPLKPTCRRNGPAAGYYAFETVQGGEDTCKYNCYNAPKCLAWQYDVDMSQCQYFDRPLSKIQACDNGKQSHILSDRDCMLCDIPADADTFYTKVKASSMLECRNLCKGDSRCKSCEFRLGDRNCWFYDKPAYQAIEAIYPTDTWVFWDVDCPF